MIPKATIRHKMDQRVRLYFLEQRREPEFFSDLCDLLLEYPDVLEVKANTVTGSVLILYKGDLARVLEYAKEKQIFEIGQTQEDRKKWTQDLTGHLRQLDRDVRRATRGDLNLASLLAMSLLGAGIFQFSRKQYLPAATSLFSDAVKLLIEINRNTSRKDRASWP